MSNEQIREMTRRICAELQPERIVLFGSYAEGRATEESDVDLLVVKETALSPPKRYAEVRKLLADFPAAFDIVVKTPDEFRRSRSVINHVVYFADKYGRVLYERK